MAAQTSFHRDKRELLRGYTVTELAVVVAIVVLLIGGLLIPLANQVELSRARQAERQLELARDALLGFAVANGRLPCPADPRIASGQPGAGIESTAIDPAGNRICAMTNPIGGVAISGGTLPWVTLGISEPDPWGRRLTYVVQSNFADEINECNHRNVKLTLCASASQPPALLEVRSRKQAGTSSLEAAAVAAFVTSHGKNGYFAYTSAGSPIAGTPGAAGGDELANAVQASGTALTARPFAYSRALHRTDAPCNDSSGPALCEFDDQVIALSRSLLVTRMASAGLFY